MQQHLHIALKEKAAALGFSFSGISRAERLDDDARQLERWLKKGHQGEMAYMERNFDMRIDPTLLVPGARSVVSLLYNYYTPQQQSDPNAPKISRYAYGKDYHFVIKDKLRELLDWLREQAGEIDGRVFVDSAPVLERSWAARSGLGWIGKNGNLINKGHGSFFFLAELIIDLPLQADAPVKDYCGSCTACIDACPTQAIVNPREIDGSRCISYFTIELKNEISPAMQGRFDNWMFGCDICQDVCPWNRFSQPHREPAFNPSPELMEMSRQDWQELTEDVFRKVFKDSPVKRTGYKGLTRNIRFLFNEQENPI